MTHPTPTMCTNVRLIRRFRRRKCAPNFAMKLEVRCWDGVGWTRAGGSGVGRKSAAVCLSRALACLITSWLFQLFESLPSVYYDISEACSGVIRSTVGFRVGLEPICKSRRLLCSSFRFRLWSRKFGAFVRRRGVSAARHQRASISVFFLSLFRLRFVVVASV